MSDSGCSSLPAFTLGGPCGWVAIPIVLSYPCFGTAQPQPALKETHPALEEALLLAGLLLMNLNEVAMFQEPNCVLHHIPTMLI